jgi:hypothetical protein
MREVLSGTNHAATASPARSGVAPRLVVMTWKSLGATS